jgi:hypothetical protein
MLALIARSAVLARQSVVVALKIVGEEQQWKIR